MIREIYIRFIAMRHVLGRVSWGMYAHEWASPRALLYTIHLRWLGGMRRGEIFWDERG